MATATLAHYGKGALRVAKNYTKGYSHTQTKVRDATSNDPWPPSGRQMHEIAQMTYNPEDFIDIMEVLDKRLNDKGKNWRHVFKSLTLLDYLIHAGSENVVRYFRDNLYIVKTLREFQHVDEQDKDVGSNVRIKAKDIVNLLQDDSRLRHERRTRARMYERMSRGRPSQDSDATDDENYRRRSRVTVSKPPTADDNDLRRALEESKRSLERDRVNAEDRDLQRALQLSKEEEEKRATALGEANLILFDDNAQPQPAPQINPFPSVNATLPLQYAVTGIQPQYTAMPMMPQFTSFNPFQQQAEQEMMQAMYVQQQQEWALHQQALQQAQEFAMQQAQQEEWQRQQASQQQLSPVLSQPTGVRIGSNNPFASAAMTPPLRETVSAGPQLQQPTGPVQFNLTGSYANRQSTASAPPPSQFQPQQQPRTASLTGTAGPRSASSRTDQQHSRLASLFANRGDDGIDTFGNIGQLRFVSTEAGRIVAQKTGPGGHNPFVRENRSQARGEDALIQL